MIAITPNSTLTSEWWEPNRYYYSSNRSFKKLFVFDRTTCKKKVARLKSENQFICLDNNTSSTESNINTGIDKTNCYRQLIDYMDIWINKTGIILDCNYVNTTVWLHHLDFNKMPEEKATWEQHTNDGYCLEQILEAAPYEMCTHTLTHRTI